MKIEKTILDNGVIVITETIPGFASASVGVWIENGSRHESLDINGISHFYEHMVFKGTKSRDSLEIVQSVESKGGYINAYTTRDHTCFYTRVIEEDVQLATEVLCDMVNEPLMDKVEFVKEKEVILEEVRASLDSPEEIIHDLFAEALWGKEGLGLPIAGYLKTVKNIEVKDLKSYQTQVKNKYQVIASAAGAVVHKDFVKQVEQGLSRQKRNTYHKTKFQAPQRKHLVKQKDVQQCNVVMGTAFEIKDIKHQLALNLFNNIFGDGMSSRLFQTIREDYGLAYSVYSCMDNYKDTMCFNVCLSLEDRKFEEAMELLSNEILQLLNDGITEAEFIQAKNTLKGGLQLSLESTNARMNFMARQLMRRPDQEPMTPQEVLAQIESIEMSEVESVIGEIFVKKNWASALIQPKGPRLSVAKCLKF